MGNGRRHHINMASKVGFEDYQQTSQNYDSTRVAFGVEVIVGAFLCGTKKPLRDLHVLDAGCGTGNYTVALSEYVGTVTGLELNEGMLGRAMEKTAGLKNITLMQGDITNMPFSDSQFDAICCNLVIHHLDGPGAEGFPMIRKFISEAYRVLKPGVGTLIINTISPEQCTSPWYFCLVPQAQQRLAKKFPDISVLEQLLSGAGFTQGPVVLLTDILFTPDKWLDKEGPFRKDWRDTVSVFALASPEELEETLKSWREKIDHGTADQHIEECEQRRKRIGLTTSLVVHKDEVNASVHF